MSGFTDHPTEDLLTVRANMLAGMDTLSGMLDAGTLHVQSSPKSCPPSSGGFLLLALLPQIDAELVSRGIPTAIAGWPADARISGHAPDARISGQVAV